MGWAAPAHTIPLFPLYALLFTHTGLSDVRISALFAIWSTVAVLAEVPLGAFADRFSRRWSVVASGGCQAAGYALWTALPGFPGFAAGFVLWGVGGALSSGALEALLHDGLVAVGEGPAFGRVLARVNAVALISTRLPETPRPQPESYLAVLRSGLTETVRTPGVGPVVLGAAGLVGHPAGLAAVALFYGAHQLVLVSAEARLQERITGDARATVTSVAGLGSEVLSMAVYGAWIAGGVSGVALLVLVPALFLSRLRR
ncbi:hypothetical protein [Saccharothrix lopnurensis]|uniref:MFS transporter n=1 Tax=Saccharothrix lopnurensis TaxID=1670621 RepID=A0ABW1P3Z0_9PSEU